MSAAGDRTMTTIEAPPRRRPSFGRSRKVRGLDLFDTPPIALGPLFVHEPFLVTASHVCEPFAGKGNLVTALREHGRTVYASDILDRGCPDSTVQDFFAMTQRPPECRLLLTNPPFSRAMETIEYALDVLKFDVVILLLKLGFLCTEERYKRLHKRGCFKRIHILAERLQDMHDATHLAKGGKKAAQSGLHAWFVIDRNHCGAPGLNVVSINDPTARMPWQRS
jgi:hypothetical protein